jgi:two-component system, OmpR family, response regulator
MVSLRDADPERHEFTDASADVLTVGGFADGARQIKVLAIEDDRAVREMIENYLTENNMRVISAADGGGVQRNFSSDPPDLVILDLKLGQDDGIDLLRAIRSTSDVPIIITTGHRRDEVDRVVGLELGADDYLTKPFGLRELLARIRAVLRRRQAGLAASRREAAQGRSRFGGGWQLARRLRRLTDPNNVAVPLTKAEYALLVAFLDAPRRPLTREYLMQATRMHEDVFDRSIDVQVLRLRRKLETDPSMPMLIKTERGIGYVFDTAVDSV